MISRVEKVASALEEEFERWKVFRQHWFVWCLGLGHTLALLHLWLMCLFPDSIQTRVHYVLNLPVSEI